MEVVDVLGDYVHVEVLLEVFEEPVCGVRLDGGQCCSAVVVELVYECGVAQIAVVAGDVHHVIVFPQSVGIAESADTAFGTYAGTGRNNEF